MRKKLGTSDAAFLFMESKECPQHAGGLMIFERPADAARSYLRDLYMRMRAFPVNREPFNMRLVDSWSTKFSPEMETIASREIDIDYHLRMSS